MNIFHVASHYNVKAEPGWLLNQRAKTLNQNYIYLNMMGLAWLDTSRPLGCHASDCKAGADFQG